MELSEYFKSNNTQTWMAKEFGVKPSLICHWVKKTRPVPIIYCWRIERMTNGQVTRQELRPNDYKLIWMDLP